MIKATDLVKVYGSKCAVDHISFEVKRGEVLGFLGPNGAGKSTTMKMLTGFLPLTEGRVDIDGHDMATDPLGAKAKIGYLPENAPVYADMTVEGFLTFAGEMRGLRGETLAKAVAKAIDECQLGTVRRQCIDTLSKGFLHRTCFAQAILHDPPVLVLDEPTDGLDPNQKHEIRQLIRRMGKEKAIIVSTHILEEVDAICDRVIIIDRGKLVFSGTPDTMRLQSPSAGRVTIQVYGVSQGILSEALRCIAGERMEVRAEETESGGVQAVISTEKTRERLAGAVKAELDRRGWPYDELHTETGRLDDVFRALTTMSGDR